MRAEELSERLSARFPGAASARDEVTVVVDREELLTALAWLRDESDLSLDFLSDLSATDWPEREPRFWIAYHLFSMRHGHRVRVKVGVPGEDAHLPSVVERYPTADWHEREVFDFFGVVFDGHPDLRRIIMPDDWEGHPLRKDHPLGGVPTRYKHGAFIPPADTRRA
jgi:NADH-quinone oxidoreductase subunit C